MIYVVHACNIVCRDLRVCTSDQWEKGGATIPDHPEFEEVDVESHLCEQLFALSCEVVEVSTLSHKGYVCNEK